MLGSESKGKNSPRSGMSRPSRKPPSSRQGRFATTSPCPPLWCGYSTPQLLRLSCASRCLQYEQFLSLDDMFDRLMADSSSSTDIAPPLQACISARDSSSPREGQQATCGPVEIEEAASGKVHPLLALAVVVEGDLLGLQHQASLQLSLWKVHIPAINVMVQLQRSPLSDRILQD